jgi:hypothetical protein
MKINMSMNMDKTTDMDMAKVIEMGIDMDMEIALVIISTLQPPVVCGCLTQLCSYHLHPPLPLLCEGLR